MVANVPAVVTFLLVMEEDGLAALERRVSVEKNGSKKHLIK